MGKTPEQTRAYQMRNRVSELYQSLQKKDSATERQASNLLEEFESPIWKNYLTGWGKLVFGFNGVHPPEGMRKNYTAMLFRKNCVVSLLRTAKAFPASSDTRRRLEINLSLLSTPLAVMAIHEGDLESMYLD